MTSFHFINHYFNKNLAIANTSRVSCAHNVRRRHLGLMTP